LIDPTRIKVIAFDADDTLWENETIFRQAEETFCTLMSDYLAAETCQQELFAIEMKNLPIYGYGIKPFALSLIEAAINLSHGQVSNAVIQKIIELGQGMLTAPNPLLDHVDQVLGTLTPGFRLVVATKGDLLDQERKLERSGLAKYFHHIEIMSDKKPRNYQKLVAHLDIRPDEFLMVGNSVNSDVLPVLEIGASTVHIPFHTTWAHEVGREPVEHPNYSKIDTMSALPALLGLKA
jgi:putative hydrolase of the HAD superfamily